MLHFLKKSNLQIKKIALVHGEEDQSVPFAELLRGGGYSVFVPKRGEAVQVE
jgi:metallo-beta-lactamase family protein